MKKYRLYVALLLFSIYTFVTGEIKYQEIKENPKRVVTGVTADRNKENTKLNVKVNKVKITPIELSPLIDKDEYGNSYFLFDFPKDDTKHKYFVTDDLDSIPRKNIVNNKKVESINSISNDPKKEIKKIEFLVKYGVLNEYDEFIEKTNFTNEETPLEVIWVKRDENLTGEYIYITKLDSENGDIKKIYSRKIPKYKLRESAPNLNANPGDMTYITLDNGQIYHSTSPNTPVHIGSITAATMSNGVMVPDTTKRSLSISGEILHSSSTYGTVVAGVFGGIKNGYTYNRRNDIAVGETKELNALKLDGTGKIVAVNIDGNFKVTTSGNVNGFQTDDVDSLGGVKKQESDGKVTISKIYGSRIARIHNEQLVWGTDNGARVEAFYTFNLGNGVLEPGYYEISSSLLPREIIIGKYNDTAVNVTIQQLLETKGAESFKSRGPSFRFLATRTPLNGSVYLVMKNDDMGGRATTWNSVNGNMREITKIDRVDKTSQGVATGQLFRSFGYGGLVAELGTTQLEGNGKFEIAFDVVNSSVLYPLTGTKRGCYPTSVTAGTLLPGSTAGGIEHRLIRTTDGKPAEDLINIYYIESIDNSDISVNFTGSPIGTWARWKPETINKTPNGTPVEKVDGNTSDVVFKKNSGTMLNPVHDTKYVAGSSTGAVENYISSIKVEVDGNKLIPEVKRVENKKWVITLKDKSGAEVAVVGFEGSTNTSQLAGEFYVAKKARDSNNYKIRITPMDELPNPQKWGTITLNLQLDAPIDLGIIGVEMYNSLHKVMMEKGQTWLKLSGNMENTASVGNGKTFVSAEKLTHVDFNTTAKGISEFNYSITKKEYEGPIVAGNPEKFTNLYDTKVYIPDKNNSLYTGDLTPKSGLEALKSIAVDLKNAVVPTSTEIVDKYNGNTTQIDVYIQGKDKNKTYKDEDMGEIYKVSVAVLFLPNYEGQRFKVETPVEYGRTNIPFYYQMINYGSAYARDLGPKEANHFPDRKVGNEVPEKNLAYGKKVDAFYVKTKMIEEIDGKVVETVGDEGLGDSNFSWTPGHGKYKVQLIEFSRFQNSPGLQYNLERNAKTHEIVSMSAGVNVPNLGFIETSSGEMEIIFGEVEEVIGEGFLTFGKLSAGTTGTWVAKEIIELSKKYSSKENSEATFELFSGELFKDTDMKVTKLKIVKKGANGDELKEVNEGAEATFDNIAITYSKGGTLKVKKIKESTELEKYSIVFLNNTVELASFILHVQVGLPETKVGSGEANMKDVKAPTIGRWSIDGTVGTPNQNLNTTGNMEFTLKSGEFYTSGDTSKIKIIKEDGTIVEGKPNAEIDLGDIAITVDTGRRELYVKKNSDLEKTLKYTINIYKEVNKIDVQEGSFSLDVVLGVPSIKIEMGTVTYKVLPSLKKALLTDSNKKYYLGGTNGQTTYSYDDTNKTFVEGTQTFNEYFERESTITFPTGGKLKFIGVEKNKTTTTDGTSLTKDSAGVYKDGNVVALGLSSTIESNSLTTLDNLAINEIKLNMSAVGIDRYSVVFLNETDGNIYYYNIALSDKTVALSSVGKIVLEEVATNVEMEFDISGKGVGSYTPTAKNTPILQITSGQVVYFMAGNTFIPQKIRYNNTDYSITTTGTKQEIVIDDEFNKFVIRDGKFYITKKKINLEDKSYTFNFLGINNEDLGTFTLSIPKEEVVEKSGKLIIKDRAFTENPNFDLINLTTMAIKTGSDTKNIEGQDLVKFEMIPNNAEDKMVGISSIQKISSGQTDLTKGTDVKGMENYGDKIYISKTGMDSIVKISDLMKNIYFDKTPLALNSTDMSKTNNYIITYVGVDNKLYKINITIETVKSVMVDGKAILDFGKLLYDSNSDFHYGETTVKVVGINKDKRVRVALQSENIELLSTTDTTQKMNVKNLGVELITPIPMASNKTISKEVQSNGEATFKIYGNAEVLRTTPVGQYSGVATVDVYILD